MLTRQGHRGRHQGQRRSLPADAREGIAFGAVTEAPAEAGVYAQLAAWLGRSLPV
jgi:hypothetical protein